ncbi:MAG TPA: hypothetical protein VFV62_11280 [Gaiellaceae bacterium]|nr:hypothetical protein [Gaiellaceae bacterium]
MVDEGFLTLDQLSAALAEQDRSGRPLGKVLVSLGFVSEGAVANALAEQHGGLLKTEFGISAGLGSAPKFALVPAGAPAPAPAAEAARIAELEAEVRAQQAEVARVTAAAVAHIDKLEAEAQAALAVRSELETTVRLGAIRISELQQEVAALREAAVVQAPVVEAPVESAHLLLTHTSDGYTLMEWPGPAPQSGTLLDVDGVRFVVLRVGVSPLPGSGLRCVFLERA